VGVVSDLSVSKANKAAVVKSWQERLRAGWDSLRKSKWFRYVISGMGTLFGLIVAIFPEWIKDPLTRFAPKLVDFFEHHPRPFLALVLISGWCVAVWAWHNSDKRRQTIEHLQEQIRLLTTGIRDRRWDTIKNVTYGHIEYDPFLKYVPGHKDPDGFGPYYLSLLLGSGESPGSPRLIEARAETRVRDWDSVFDGMAPHICDVIATPLFATFDRSTKARFTAPLFFSNIGLYMNKEGVSRTFLEGISVQNLTERLRDNDCTPKTLQFLSIKGEISEKMALKYAPWLVDERAGKFLISGLLNEIASGALPSRALFCETYVADEMIKQLQAEREKAGRAPFPDVANVLPPRSILYPVCFAVPFGDYQLANLLNIRLLQLTQKKSALDELAEWLFRNQPLVDGKRPEENLTKFVENVKTHFVDEWPSMELKDGTNA
jgi:hypothetical protein